jgi:hypothetical protein
LNFFGIDVKDTPSARTRAPTLHVIGLLLSYKKIRTQNYNKKSEFENKRRKFNINSHIISQLCKVYLYGYGQKSGLFAYFLYRKNIPNRFGEGATLLLT